LPAILKKAKRPMMIYLWLTLMALFVYVSYKVLEERRWNLYQKSLAAIDENLKVFIISNRTRLNKTKTPDCFIYELTLDDDRQLRLEVEHLQPFSFTLAALHLFFGGSQDPLVHYILGEQTVVSYCQLGALNPAMNDICTYLARIWFSCGILTIMPEGR
jgi:hypothetical protein